MSNSIDKPSINHKGLPMDGRHLEYQALLETYRYDFPSLERRRNEKSPVYMDSACTTLVPRQVIAAINEYYTDYPSCAGRRARHWFAEEVTQRIEGNTEKGVKGARMLISEFIHASSESEIIFTLNTTHAINMVALGLKFKPGDVVLLTDREHNSNLLPWLRLQKSGQIRVEHTTANNGNTFDLEAFENHFKEKQVRLVSMAWTSNVTGTTVPAKEIIDIAHRYGARVLLDGAQTVPHQAVDVCSLDVDFLAFSLHKMCGPRGVGVLYGKRELLGSGANEWEAGADVLEPAILGGGTVGDTTYDSYRLSASPERFEAGIQNYGGQIASGAAVQYLSQIGMDRITIHEHELNEYLTEILLNRFGNTAWFKILGPLDAIQRGGILTFEVRRPNAVGIAKELNAKNNVMIRDGVFCAHSYFNEQYGPNWTHPISHHDHRMMYRVSLYLYNTMEECDLFLETLDEIFEERSYL
jgi:cysteine desulfurase / selenocysteine lyase